MNSRIRLVALLLAATITAAGCKAPGYKVPTGGVSISDSSGLQITATSVKAGKNGFTVTFDFANTTDNGLLVPFTDIQAAWGEQTAKVDVDAKRLRKECPWASLRLPGSIDYGLFQGTNWVTGASGDGPRGDAVYVKAKSRVQKFVVVCTVPQQPGGELSVRWPHIYSGDAQGTITATVANDVSWTMPQGEVRKFFGLQ